LGKSAALPDRIADPLLAQCASIAEHQRFLHWPLAFPEVFSASRPGFDAIVGNPPWDMVRGDSGSDDVRDRRRHDARHLTEFVRGSGIYRVETRAHVNRYQLFLERALQARSPWWSRRARAPFRNRDRCGSEGAARVSVRLC
jgi:hypothetical protein